MNKKVDWVYISIDNDKNRWLRHLKALNETVKNFAHYKILNKNSKSDLLTYFKIRRRIGNSSQTVIALPRYLIINNDNNVLLNNAPKPTDSIAFKKVIKILKNKNL